MAPVTTPERISIELTNRCGKACWFCYNGSAPTGAASWTVDELVALVEDCVAHGTRAVSFGGGEPLEFSGVFELLDRLRGICFRSLTTNGLGLTAQTIDSLSRVRPDKIHVSIHFPSNKSEVERVIEQVHALAACGLRSGVNLLVARSGLAAGERAAGELRAAGIGNDRIVYLPMRGQDTPTPDEVARVAGGNRFQSMTCLAACAASERFCSISWNRRVGWCSYTDARRALDVPTAAALAVALDGLGLNYCGGSDDGLLRLSGSPQHGHNLVRGRP